MLRQFPLTPPKTAGNLFIESLSGGGNGLREFCKKHKIIGWNCLLNYVIHSEPALYSLACRVFARKNGQIQCGLQMKTDITPMDLVGSRLNAPHRQLMMSMA